MRTQSAILYVKALGALVKASLEQHAKNELQLAGLFDKDSDYGGVLGEAVMALVRIFAKQGHSGMSAMMTLEIFDMVARFKPLSPLTSNSDEWIDVSEMSGKPLWQNRRCPSTFSKDGGKTWYDINEQAKAMTRGLDPPSRCIYPLGRCARKEKRKDRTMATKKQITQRIRRLETRAATKIPIGVGLTSAHVKQFHSNLAGLADGLILIQNETAKMMKYAEKVDKKSGSKTTQALATAYKDIFGEMQTALGKVVELRDGLKAFHAEMSKKHPGY